MSITGIPIYFNNYCVFLHKEHRGYNNTKITHSNFLSLIRVLGFSYLGFKCTNLEDILKRVREYLYCSTDAYQVKRATDECTSPSGVLIGGGILFDKIVSYQQSHTDTPTKNDAERFGLWVFGKPIIVQNDHNVKSFKYQNDLELSDFVMYINEVFNSNISAILQNPIMSIFLELKYKYNMYKIFNNINLFRMDVFPSIYDFLVTDLILEYIKNVSKDV